MFKIPEFKFVDETPQKLNKLTILVSEMNFERRSLQYKISQELKSEDYVKIPSEKSPKVDMGTMVPCFLSIDGSGDFYREARTWVEVIVGGIATLYSSPEVENIVFNCLESYCEDVLLIHHPETHLSSRAAFEMGKFLARVSSGGEQVIVETHSEDIVYGIRVAIAQKVVDGGDVSLLYFERDKEEKPKCSSSGFDSSGDFLEYPDNLFAVKDEALSILTKARIDERNKRKAKENKNGG